MEPRFIFSASTLKTFEECPRCFWFQFIKNIKRPRGHFPGLPGGVDLVLKKYFDGHRKNHTMPEEIAPHLPDGAELFRDAQLVHDWQDWRTGLSYTSPKGIRIIAAIDECLQIGECLAPMDYKTMKNGNRIIEDSIKYSELQLSVYSFQFKNVGYKVTKKGYLLNYYPIEARDGAIIKFGIKVFEIPADPKLCIETTAAAVKCLDNPAPPEMKEGCEYCIYREGL